MIESYSFGSVEIDGRTYTSDVIIYGGRVDSAWWRKEGHSLALEDIREVIDEKPEVLVVGTGASGVMRVLPETAKLLKERGIRLVADRTAQACTEYNKMVSEGKSVVAALHLTC